MGSPDRDDELVASVSRDPAVWHDVAVSLAAVEVLLASGSAGSTVHVSEQRSDGVWTLPWFEYATEVDELHAALGRAALITPLADWADRHDPSRFAGPGDAAAAPTAQLVRFVTATFRGERFSEGTIAAALEAGTLTAVVRELVARFGGA